MVDLLTTTEWGKYMKELKKKRKKGKLEDMDSDFPTPRFASLFLFAIIAITGILFAQDAANASLNSTSNETVKEVVAQAGQGSFDIAQAASTLFNNQLTDAVAQILNGLLGTTWITGAIVLTVFVLGVLYFKWNTIMQWFGHVGSYIILGAIAFIVAKGMGIL